MMELLPELTMIPSLSPPFFNLLPASALAANFHQTSPKSNGRSSHGSTDVLEKDEKLCDYYRRMPVLYDKSHPHYKFQSKKEKAWRELSRLCEMDVEQCKKRMTYFRCRFTVERRIMKNGVNCSEWPLLEKLKFLNKHIKIRRPRAPNGEPDDTDDETNPMNILRKRQREQQEDAKDDLHAYLDLQQMAVAAQNSHAQLQYQQHLKLQGHGPFGGPPGTGFPSAHDPMGLHHLQPPHPHQRDHQLPPPHGASQPGGGGGGGAVGQPGGPAGQQHGSHAGAGAHHHHHPFGRSGMPTGGHHPHHHPHGPGGSGAAGSAAVAAAALQQQQQHGAGGGAGGGAAGHPHAHHHQQPTPVESPIPAAMSNVEVSYGLPKRSRVGYDGDEASLSNFNLNRTVKYQNNLEHQAHLDEHGAYGLYVGEVLRKLPERISSLTSLKIMQLLYEAQVQSFDAAPSSAAATPKPSSQSKGAGGGAVGEPSNGPAGGGGAAPASSSSIGSLLANGGGATSVASSEGGRQSTESAESMSNNKD
ncbi:la-related protein Larp4B isoform X2 [Anopheles gambiae]|uniref:la-related protein Larp4B isoform X2 n=1 Tax=Anopheles gambiae TaxID=7165 RepID=UPI002AC8B000|nr:la-related protein Larp4B isoform X2 [Anopheles gambiae]XP_061496942.1 la-related protein Larp4B isoform X2 [Anopheles gambiae]